MQSKLDLYRNLNIFVVDFIRVSSCPLCGDKSDLGENLPIDAYRFGDCLIKLPLYGVRLIKCKVCSLQYKDLVPSQKSLEGLFEVSAKSVWADKKVPFTKEKDLLKYYLTEGDGSLIDIGSSDGALLRAMKEICTILSALDVYEDLRCRNSISGEYALGFIEDFKISLQQKYSVATVFDVFEHLYSPSMAAKNFKKILHPRGIIFGETGNTDSRLSTANWWYVHLIEHHIFWNKVSLDYFCKKHGFSLELISPGAHKGRRYLPIQKRLVTLLLHTIHKTFLAKLVWDLIKIDPSMVGNPFARDHIIFAIRNN